jgi:hypothetical protein
MPAATPLDVHFDLVPELRGALLRDLDTQLERVLATGRGEIIVVEGAPGIGKTALAALWTARLNARHGSPRVIAGRFGGDQGRGGLRGWLLEPPGLLPRLSGRRAANLADWLSAAAAAGAVADPTGAAKTVVALATLTGQAGSAAAGRTNTGATAAVGADGFAHIVDALTQDGRPLVIVLDDLDRAHPSLDWLSVLLRRRLADLMASRPILVIATADQSDLRGELDVVLEDMAAERFPLGGVTHDDVTTWLSTADPRLIDDLLACAGGHPGWTTAIYMTWARAGLIVQRGGRWEYAPGAIERVAATAREHIRSRIWSMTTPDTAAFDRAEMLLRAAALEGSAFTADVLAQALGEERDAVVAWLDAYLVAGDEDGLIRRVQARRRDLVRYAFVSPLIPVALRDGPVGDIVARYAAALIGVHGASASSTTTATAASLYARTGDRQAAEHYKRIGVLAGNEEHLNEILLEERHAQTHPSSDAWPAWRWSLSAARLVYGATALRHRYRPDDAIMILIDAYGATRRAIALEPDAAVEITASEALLSIAHICAECDWLADLLVTARAAIAIAETIDHLDVTVWAAVACVGTYIRIAKALDADNKEWTRYLTTCQLPLDLSGDPLLVGAPDELSTADLMAEATALLDRARAEAARTRTPIRGHARGEVAMATGDLAYAQGYHASCVSAFRDATRFFASCDEGKLCRRAATAHGVLFSLLKDTEPQLAEASGLQALRAYIADGMWAAAAKMQHDRAHAVWDANGAAAAVVPFIAAVHLQRERSHNREEGSLWRCLGKVVREAGQPELGTRCLGMAAYLMAEDARNLKAVRADLGPDVLTEAMRYAALARGTRRGGGLLYDAFGTTPEAIEQYLRDEIARADDLTVEPAG